METTIKLEKRIEPSRRRFLQGLVGAGVTAYTSSAYTPFAFAQRRKRISDEARNRIWKNYPQMQGAIDLINRGAFEGLIDYALYPNQGYYDPRGIPTSVRKIPRGDMDTPHYWLLLKILEGDGYNIFADNNGEPFLGVPPPPSPPSGVWYFARGLRTGSPDNESNLLKALYIGATGSPDGAEPIINGTFMNVSGVREKVREWREEYDFAPHSDEGNHLLAYNLNILREAIFPNTEHFKGRELVELSLLGLEDFYDEVYSPEKSNIYGGRIVGDLTKKDKLPGYFMIDEAGAESPLPVLRFHSR